MLSNSMSFGRPYILKLDGAIHDGWLAIQYYETVFDTEFLYYLISSNITQSQFYKTASGTAVKNLNSDKVGQTILFVPPLAEQERIVTKINQLFDLVDRIERDQEELQELSKQLKQKVLDVAMQGKLVPQDPTDEPASVLLEKIREEKQKLFEAGKIKKKDLVEVPISDVGCAPYGKLPKGWEMARLSWIAILYNGRAYKKHEMLKDSSKTPLLRVGNLFTSNDWYYSDLNLEETKYIDCGQLIYAWAASFGPFIWKGEKVIYHYHIWRIDLYATVMKEYLYHQLYQKSNEIRTKTTGSTMVHITKQNMENLIIPIPPEQEQSRIVQKLNRVNREIEKLG